MSIFSVLSKVWTWFTNGVKKAAPIAITITEEIKALLENSVTGFVTSAIDSITRSHIASDLAALIDGIIPKILAVELGIEGLPDNPTPEQILAFENAVLAAFKVSNKQSKIYTELSAQIYGILQADSTKTFASLVKDVEEAYQDYLADVAAQAA